MSGDRGDQWGTTTSGGHRRLTEWTPDTREPWMDDGLCAQIDPEIFFPEKGGSTRDAKKICSSCEVVDRCLAYAMKNDERFGIWGGLSERERRRLRRGEVAPATPHARAWTPERLQRLREMHANRWTDKQMGVALGVTAVTVASHRKDLGLPAWGARARRA